MKGVPVRGLFVHFFPINSSLFGTRIAISKIHPCVLLGFSLSSYLSETESLTSISWPTSKATKNIPGFGIRRIHSAEKKKKEATFSLIVSCCFHSIRLTGGTTASLLLAVHFREKNKVGFLNPAFMNILTYVRKSKWKHLCCKKV